jgi:predicted CoA-binding protein
MTEDEKIEKIIKDTKTIAVIGLSPEPSKDSHNVSAYLQEHGYKIIPVYPGEDEILGEKVYRNVSEITGNVDTVLIFRKPEYVLAEVRESLKIKPKYIWMQKEIINEEAAGLAEAHGVLVVMDKCMREEFKKLFG